VTGEAVSVANWPGTTVEKKEASLSYNGEKLCLIDLPGAYNLLSVSLEEKITLRELIFGDYDAVIVLVDSLSMTKSLYFAIQVLELTSKVVIALTKFDEAHSKGVHIREDGISQALGVPVIPISSVTGLGIDRLLETAVMVAKGQLQPSSFELEYPTLESSIKKIESELMKRGKKLKWNERWIAVKLLEQEELVSDYIYSEFGGELRVLVENEIKEHIEKYNRTPRDAIVSYRYNFVEKVIQRNVKEAELEAAKPNLIERVLENAVLGPIFSTLIYLGIFSLAFTLNTGFPLNYIFSWLGKEAWAAALENYSISGILSSMFSYLASFLREALQDRAPDLLVSLIADGIVPGVGSVISFLPLIMVSIAFLAILEDSGLGARMAIAYDAILNKFGLSGKSSFPLLLSLGCNVPGVLSTRILEDSSERKALIYSIPFVPCQARLVIMMAFAAVLFRSPILSGLSIAFLYSLSILIALLTSRFISWLSGSVEERGLLVEIPPMHKPIWKVIWWHVWDNSKHFLTKAGTVILALSVIIWFALTFSPSFTVAESPQNSIAFQISSILSPIGRLYDLSGDLSWKTSFMFLNGFLAKESFIESIMLFNPNAQSLTEAVSSLDYTPQQALSILVAANLYIPCIATLSVMYSETKSIKGVLLFIAYSTSIAIALSYAVFLITSHL